MRAIRNYKTVLISAFVPYVGAQENYIRHCNLQGDLITDFKYKCVTSFCNGEEEYDLVIPCNEGDINVLRSIANHYEQNSILVVNEDDSCYLLFADGTSMELGKFKPVSKQTAMESNNYTYDHSTNIYYKAI